MSLVVSTNGGGSGILNLEINSAWDYCQISAHVTCKPLHHLLNSIFICASVTNHFHPITHNQQRRTFCFINSNM